MENVEKEQEQSPDKVKKKFDATIKLLSSVLGGEKNLKLSNKVEKTELDKIVEELFKEQREKNAKEIKTQLEALLKGYVDMNQMFDAKVKELEKLKQEKMKQFTKDADALWNRVVSINKQQADYGNALKDATGEPDEASQAGGEAK